MQLSGKTLPDGMALVAPFRPPPGLELLDCSAQTSVAAARRSWADVVKSKSSMKDLGNNKGSLALESNDSSEDTDEETRASSMIFSEDDHSDEEPSEVTEPFGGKLNADAPSFVPVLNVDAEAFVPNQSASVTISIETISTQKLSDVLKVEARTPLKSTASMFVPFTPIPTGLRTQAMAYVPQGIGYW